MSVKFSIGVPDERWVRQREAARAYGSICAGGPVSKNWTTGR
jgi:hypothetical protein